MAAALPVLVNRDLNRAKNKKASDEVIPFVYKTVIAWGCPKNKDESFLTYYKRRPEKLWEDNKGEWEKEVEDKLKNRVMTKWPKANKEKEKEKIKQQLKEEKAKELLIMVTWKQENEQHLNQKTCDGLDASFLHKLVPTICDGFGHDDPNAPSSTNIEQFLREVKDIRDYIFHDPKGASNSDTILDDLEVSAVNVFKAAGDLYAPSLDQQAVQDKTDVLKEKLQKIKNEIMTDEQLRILQTAKKMSVDGMAEMHAAVKLQETDFMPLSDDKVTRTDVFHSVDLLIINFYAGSENAIPENENKKTTREIASHELLEHFEGSNILCVGQPGTGKTTLLKTLREDFGKETENRFRGVRKFDLLMYVVCRNNSITTVEQLLEHHFPKTFQQLTKEEAIKALLELKLLICVDGLDELTSHTEELLRELIRKFGHSGNATFIFTNRFCQSPSVSLRFEIVTLQLIKEEDQQVEFLRRYQASIKGFTGPALINVFKSLNETCKAVLRQPVYLALFCALFRKVPHVVNEWKNEVTLHNDFLSLSKQTMIDRMANRECYAEKMTNKICNLSVYLLQKEVMILTAMTCTKLCEDIFHDASVEYYPIVSTFFTKHPDQQTFEFYHKSHAEFLAAKAIEQRFVGNPAAGVVSTIQVICSEQSHYFQDGIAPSPAVTDGEDVSLKRFENVLRFVCMLIHEGGQPMKEALQRFLAEICPALAKEKVGLDNWTDLVLSCPDSVQVAQAAAEAVQTVSGKEWRVTSSQAMIATSKMLPYRQPRWMSIEPLWGDDYHAALTELLDAVAHWYTGTLILAFRESHANYSACDASLACLEAAPCRLNDFEGCLSGRSNPAWRALIEGAKRAPRSFGRPWLHISLLDPMCHELSQLEGTSHSLYITVRLPYGLGDRRSRPLPANTYFPPQLRVEFRLADGRGAPADEGATAALIEDLAPEDMRYRSLFLLHYPGPDGVLDGMLATLMARGVRTIDSNKHGWKVVSKNIFMNCAACGNSSSHRPGERCVILHLC